MTETTEELQARIDMADRAIRSWRRAYFRDNPPNTYLANVFNDILRALGTFEVNDADNAARESKSQERLQ